MSKQTLAKMNFILAEAFPNSEIEVLNPKNDGIHFDLTLKSPSFKGLSKLQQQRKVNEVLWELLKNEVHALSMQTDEL